MARSGRATRPAYLRDRARTPAAAVVAVLSALALLVSAGCGDPPEQGPTPGSAGSAPGPGGSVGAASRPSPGPPPTLPRGGRTLFPRWRVVAFYGAAGIPAMGVLGSGDPDEVWSRLAERARRYSRPGRPALPAYELIAVIARGRAGADGKYRSRVDARVIDAYLRAARRHRALLILDVQPGRSGFLTEVKRLERWLAEPDVALALDPEWRVRKGARPGQRIGSTSAAEINEVSRWLDALTARRRLPQKLLVVHQFTRRMIQGKRDVAGRDHLAITFNMDGFGSPEAKRARYRMLAEDERFPLGFKLFFDQDVRRLDPREVLDLDPPPSVVEYQ